MGGRKVAGQVRKANNTYPKLPSAKSFAIFCVAGTGVVVVANWLLNFQAEERKDSALTSGSSTAVGATGDTAQLVAGLCSVLLHGLASLGILRANWMAPPQQKIVKPVAMFTSEQAVFQQELAGRVSVSDALRKQYAADEVKLAQMVEHANDLFLHMVSEAPDRFLFCEFKSVLEGENFKIVLCDDNELDSYALFYRWRNTIFIRLSSIQNDREHELVSMLRHEIHHAKVNRDNRLNGYRYINKDGTEDPNSTPCAPMDLFSRPTPVNCHDIIKIQKSGLERIRKIVSAHTNSSGTDLQKQYRSIMRKISYNYDRVDLEVKREMIQQFIAKKVVDSSWQVIREGGDRYIKLTVGSPDSLPRYAESFYEKAGKIFAVTRSYKLEDVDIALLRDLTYLLDVYRHSSAGDKIKEYDAIIMQILGPYPELMELLFPKYHQYHERRSDEAYQQCVASPNP